MRTRSQGMDMDVHMTLRGVSCKGEIAKPATSQGDSPSDTADAPRTPLNTSWLRKRASVEKLYGYNEPTLEQEGAKNVDRPKHAVRLTASEAEEWQRFPFLELGYRRAGLTYLESIRSMFGSLHNETMNVWTMVASVIIGASLFSMHVLLDPDGPRGWDASPSWAMLVAQMTHAPAAIGYHTFMAVSPGTAYTWRRLDLSLVLVLNTLSTYALSYFTLPWLATLAITAVACYCAVTGIYSILLLKKGQPLDRGKVISRVAGCTLGYYGVVIYRGVVAAIQDAALAAAASVAASQPRPAADPFLAQGGDAMSPHSTSGTESGAFLGTPSMAFIVAFGSSVELWTAIGLMGCHGLGAACYMTHWPQKRFPRTFDLCGFSHNIMHVMCFMIFVWGYPYLALLHSKKDAWFGNA